MSIVHDFSSINRKLNRMEQKAEWDEKNPKVDPAMYGWPYGITSWTLPGTENLEPAKFDWSLFTVKI